MTTYAEFNKEISAIEGQLAYGGETSYYGHFVDRMTKLGGPNWRESDAEMDDEEVAWWVRCYDLIQADAKLPADEQATDVSDIFERV